MKPRDPCKIFCRNCYDPLGLKSDPGIKLPAELLIISVVHSKQLVASYLNVSLKSGWIYSYSPELRLTFPGPDTD